MSALHCAALVRAYRTLAQGLGGSAVVTALVAVVAAASDADALRSALLAAGIAVGTVFATAVGSFWQGVAAGLPEVPTLTPSEVEADAQSAANDKTGEPYVGRHEAS